MANQLAQQAVGWQATFDGPSLLGGPTTGRYVMDLVRTVTTVNGREAEMGMMSILDEWLRDDLARLHRDRAWIHEAVVDVQYELVPSDVFMDSNPGHWTSLAFMARLKARARVATSDGEAAEATFENAQAVNGQKADPVRPMPRNNLPAALQGKWRPVEIKGTRRPKGSQT